jgi:hypothetical protein
VTEEGGKMIKLGPAHCLICIFCCFFTIKFGGISDCKQFTIYVARIQRWFITGFQHSIQVRVLAEIR